MKVERGRIVYLIDSLGMGGAERLMVSGLKHLDSGRFEARVCTFQVRDGNTIADDLRQMGIAVDMIPLRHLRNPGGLLRVAQYLHRQRADLLHTQLEFANTIGSAAARLLGIPAVSTLHTFDEPTARTRAYWRLRLMWWSLRHFCRRIITVSEATRKHHIRVAGLPAEKMVTIYNGIDLSLFNSDGCEERSAGRMKLGVPPGARVIMTVAVLRPPKGIQYMIEAMPAVLAQVPDAYYVVMGGGEHEAVLKKLAERPGLQGRVIFTGTRQDVPRLLPLADLFVLPTLNDALPTVAAEAMASGLPVVASAVGGVPEMVVDGRTGILLPPADVPALANACVELLRDGNKAARYGQAGRALVEQRFDARRQGAELGELYEELTGDFRF